MGKRKYMQPSDWMVPGQPVWYRPVLGGPERIAANIRVEPWQLGHGAWVVKITDYVGGVAIEAIEKRDPSEAA